MSKPTSLPLSISEAVRAHAFVVEAIEAVELDAVERDELGVVVDREPVRRDVLADVARERLAAGQIFLAVTLDAVTEHLVEEHAGGAALEDRRADVRLGERRRVQRVEIAGDRADHLVDFGVVGQILRLAPKRCSSRDRFMPSSALTPTETDSCAFVHDCWITVPSLFTK